MSHSICDSICSSVPKYIDVSLGLFYRDDVNKKRWILPTCGDPRMLAGLDAVFINVEPNAGARNRPASPSSSAICVSNESPLRNATGEQLMRGEPQIIARKIHSKVSDTIARFRSGHAVLLLPRLAEDPLIGCLET